MNQKALNEYFKHLCEAYCVAQEEKKRLKKKLKTVKDKDLSMEYEVWLQHKEALLSEIEEIIEEINRKRVSIIITTRQEVIYFINLFSSHYCFYKFRIINMEEINLKRYPAEDKLCVDFYKAYCLQDYEEMLKLYKKVS